MKVEASAPSNIALIKYMGKSAVESNLPTNASLSYTLEHLRSFVTIDENESGDRWEPLTGLTKLELSEFGKNKFLTHFSNLKKRWSISGTHTVCSANNFPSDCGLASSASSFAALTLATYELSKNKNVDRLELSKASRLGSGSSCRSFFSPWAVWRGEGAEPSNLSLQLEHAVVIVGADKKMVSSSEAHKRVSTSLLFHGRPERAEKRLVQLEQALGKSDWKESFELCWAEFQDMHALFETSQPSFGYWNEGSVRALNYFRKIWNETGDGPLVTMDAGANVHILLRKDQTKSADQWLKGWNSLRSWNA